MSVISCASMFKSTTVKFRLSAIDHGQKTQNAALLVAALLLLVLPFDVEHLLTMIVGAGVYWFIRASQVSVKRKPRTEKMVDIDNDETPSVAIELGKYRSRTVSGTSPAEKAPHAGRPQCDSLTESVVPLTAPVFQSTTWAESVNELLQQIAPTTACEESVGQLGNIVKQAVRVIFPDAEVESFVWGNLQGGKAFGVAVPDVEIVVNVCPKLLLKHMQVAGHANGGRAAEPDLRQLKKCAIRVCTDRMASGSGLKFRRSAFTGDEPKVTFLAPTVLGIADTSVPFDFYINSTKSTHMAALLKECERTDSRAKQLILLVRRWAKDRGICFAAKGHLAPYVWSILAMFYMQAGSDCGPLLPPFEGSRTAKSKKRHGSSSEKSISELFNGFFHFYAVEFDWCTEAVDIRVGKRAAPSSSLPRHVQEYGKRSIVGPSIEDPFMVGSNLASGMTSMSFARLKEELARADKLCINGESLTTLLEPWAPSVSDPSEVDERTAQPNWARVERNMHQKINLSAPVLESVRLGPAMSSRAKTTPQGLLSAPPLESVRLGPASAPWRRDRLLAKPEVA